MMKKIIWTASLVLALAAFSAPASAHCGACGVGDAAAEDSAGEADCSKGDGGKDCSADCESKGEGKGEGNEHPAK